MAVRFDIKKYEQIKEAYLKYLSTGLANPIELRNFDAYKVYLEADKEVKAHKASIKKKDSISIFSALIKKNNSTTEKELFLHPRIAKILKDWEERISTICEKIEKNGINKKELANLKSELGNASLTREQRKQFIALIERAYAIYKKMSKQEFVKPRLLTRIFSLFLSKLRQKYCI